jgi:GT2 family glycosyltransferase
LSPLLSVIIVNWNVRDLLRACLKSVIRSSTGLELEIIVVDSGSSDGSVVMLRDDFPPVRVIACDQNIGFSAGNNQGIAAARGEYLLCLNPDTEVVGNALELMKAFLQANPTVGVVGPRLLYSDGTTQSSRRRFPNLATAFLESTILQQWIPHNRVLDRYYMANQPDAVTQDVDWLMGACFMLRRAVVAQVGPFDEGFFMYSEELDWMKRIRTAGWRVVYLPEAQVIHYEGKSSEQVVPLRHIRFQSSKVRYFRKHHGLLAGEMVWAFLMATYVFQLVEEAAKWALGHKRPMRRERIGAYWAVLRSGLRA